MNGLEEYSIFDRKSTSKVTHRQLRLWMADLREKGVSPRSVGRKISSTKTYFSFLVKSEVLESNPATRVKIPGYEKNNPAF